MGTKKLTSKQVEELHRAYDAWNPHDPGSETAAELAERFGISKFTLYSYRARWADTDRSSGDAGAIDPTE